MKIVFILVSLLFLVGCGEGNIKSITHGDKIGLEINNKGGVK
ncbi:hypothetical protein [Bathymodiolus septemdierum thioautotrophic gill symbiont]|nr:hypothetical protein [Bathymodiolus septemdierum thioautotrophic gill symbiont]